MQLFNERNRNSFFAPREQNQDIIFMRNPYAKAAALVGRTRAGISFGENITLFVALDPDCVRLPVIRFFANNKGLRDCPYGWLKKHAQPLDDSSEAKVNFETAVRDFCREMRITHLGIDATEQGVDAKNIECLHVSWDTQLKALDWLNGESYVDPNCVTTNSSRINGTDFRNRILGHRGIDDPWALLSYFISSQKRRGLDVSDWNDSVTPILALLNAISVTDRFHSWIDALATDEKRAVDWAEHQRQREKERQEKAAAQNAARKVWLSSPEYQEQGRREEADRLDRERLAKDEKRIGARRLEWKKSGSIREQLRKFPSSGSVRVELAHGQIVELNHTLAKASISRGDAILAE